MVRPGGRRAPAGIHRGGDLVPGGGTSRDASMTVTPPESANDLEGPARVRCEVSRAGRGYIAKVTTVNVPGPSGASSGSTVDAHD